MLVRCKYCQTRTREGQLPIHEKHCLGKRRALKRALTQKAEAPVKEVPKVEPKKVIKPKKAE